MGGKYDDQAIDLAYDLYNLLTGSRRNDQYDAYNQTKFISDVAPTLAAELQKAHDEGAAEARQRENEKCRELIGARVGAMQ